jgi:hypothetical protein
VQHVAISPDSLALRNLQLAPARNRIGMIHLRHGQMEPLSILFRQRIQNATVFGNHLQHLGSRS